EYRTRHPRVLPNTCKIRDIACRPYFAKIRDVASPNKKAPDPRPRALTPLPSRGEGLKVLCTSGARAERRFYCLHYLSRNHNGILRCLLQAVEIKIWTCQQGFECTDAVSQKPCKQLISGCHLYSSFSLCSSKPSSDNRYGSPLTLRLNGVDRFPRTGRHQV